MIPNGFDLERFKPDTDARASVRSELAVEPDTLLVGLIARYDPYKDHENFFRAARGVVERLPKVRFVLCGDGVTPQNDAIMDLVRKAGLANSCLLLGRRPDVPRILSALDISCLSSLAEGFPNVVGEAMACGVPCVVTDVGDAREILGPTGLIVAPRDSEALSRALIDLLSMPAEQRRGLGRQARERIELRFSLPRIVSRYEALYDEITASAGLHEHRDAHS